VEEDEGDVLAQTLRNVEEVEEGEFPAQTLRNVRD
jgi:hypothetical protein